ncbi:MAG: type II toxin-antitoxin system RelE/ParE family toxin, partial [Streptosporangiaceae bacterium]
MMTRGSLAAMSVVDGWPSSCTTGRGPGDRPRRRDRGRRWRTSRWRWPGRQAGTGRSARPRGRCGCGPARRRRPGGRLSDHDFKRVDEVCGMLAEKGPELGGPWSDHLEGAVWELRIRLRDVAARITYWCTSDGRIVLLTVVRKTRQHDQRQIDRALRAQELG